jgi:hypothetical protein
MPSRSLRDTPSRRAQWLAIGREALMGLDPLWSGFIGSLLVLAGSLEPNSPFTSKIPGSWFIGVPSSPHAGDPLLELGANALVWLGIFLGGIAWLRLVLGIRAGESFPHKWLMFALWVAPLMIAGPLFSRDVYSYAAQGQMVTQGINPYSGGPALLGNSPFMATVDPLWGNAKAPYGPLFLMMDGALVSLSGHSPLVSVLLLRLAALASVVVIGVLVLRIADLLGVNRDLAFALSAVNPILLYTFASAGHNDSEMTALMVVGVYLFLKDRRLAGIVMVALAASIKVPAIVALGFMGYQWTRSDGVWSRLRGLAIAVMIAVAVFIVLGVVSHLGLGWIPALSTPGSVWSFEDPIVVVGFALGWVASHVGLPFGPVGVIGVLRILGDALTLLVGGVAILGSSRGNWVRLAGVILIVTVVLGPVIWPWYLGWGIVLLALGAGDLITDTLVLLTLAALPIDLLGLPTVLAWFGYAGLALVLWRRRQGLVIEARATWHRFLVVLGEVLPVVLRDRLPRALRVG